FESRIAHARRVPESPAKSGLFASLGDPEAALAAGGAALSGSPCGRHRSACLLPTAGRPDHRGIPQRRCGLHFFERTLTRDLAKPSARLENYCVGAGLGERAAPEASDSSPVSVPLAGIEAR